MSCTGDGNSYFLIRNYFGMESSYTTRASTSSLWVGGHSNITHQEVCVLHEDFFHPVHPHVGHKAIVSFVHLLRSWSIT